MSNDFDLLIEPWIPVVDLSGRESEVSLITALERAHELREVADESPLVTFAIYRFLAAVLQVCMPVRDIDQWADQWAAQRIPASVIALVQSICAGRLNLFDRSLPFLQSADLPPIGLAKSELKTVGSLFHEESTGTNVTLFSHRGDRDHAYCPVCCVKGLLVQPPFATSGGAGIRPSINGVPPLYVMPGLDTLFGTLLINHLSSDFHPRTANKARAPSLWSPDGIVPAKCQVTDVSFVESLVWAPRRMRLFPSDGGRCSRCGRLASPLVRSMVYTQGKYRPEGLPPWDDPWVAYREEMDADGKSIVKPVRPVEERATWRDVPTLFLRPPQSRTTRWRQPKVLGQLALLQHEEILPAKSLPVRCDVFGIRTDMKAKVYEWRHDHFIFPLRLLDDDRAARTVESALGMAEEAASTLAMALKMLHPATHRRNADPKARAAAMQALRLQTARLFWQNMAAPFRDLLADRRVTLDVEERRSLLYEWWKKTREEAKRALEEMIENFDSDAEELCCQVRARHVFYGRLAKYQQKLFDKEGLDA